MHQFHPSIIREYDVRGVVGKTLSEADAYALGRCFAAWTGGGRIAVGRDGRVSSPGLQAALMDGLEYGGCDVVDIGPCPTPMLYYAVKAVQGMMAGIMVTGSHNPPTHNGFKMTRSTGSVYGDQIKELTSLVSTLPEAVVKRGSRRSLDIKENYVEDIVGRAGDALEKFQGRVVWDCGNGAAGYVIKDVLVRLNGQHEALYAEVDGGFPNHHPDPTVEENLEDLKKEVLKGKADIGLAFDGDGDRLGVIDENARFIPMDDLIALLAADVLEENNGAAIIADVKCAPSLFKEIARLKGEPIMWRTGHSPIKAKMVDSKSPFAGEYSGHLFFADRYHGFDDGVYAALRVLNILAKKQKPFSQLLAHLPLRTGLPELRLDVDDDQKFVIVDRFKDLLQNHPQFPKGGSISTIDGIRVETDEGWLLLRASNTQGALVLRLEAANPGALEALRALVMDVFGQLSLPEIAAKIAA